jgi:hypothetical protein
MKCMTRSTTIRITTVYKHSFMVRKFINIRLWYASSSSLHPPPPRSVTHHPAPRHWLQMCRTSHKS